MRCQKGFSLVEAVMAMALLGAGAYAVISGLDMLKERKGHAGERMDLEIVLASALEQIRSNIGQEKIDFKARENFLDLSDPQQVKESLQMRWDGQGIKTKAACPTCKGRLGYVVYPYKVGGLAFKGLFQVVIRVTHDKMTPNGFKEYKFIVRGP